MGDPAFDADRNPRATDLRPSPTPACAGRPRPAAPGAGRGCRAVGAGASATHARRRVSATPKGSRYPSTATTPSFACAPDRTTRAGCCMASRSRGNAPARARDRGFRAPGARRRTLPSGQVAADTSAARVMPGVPANLRHTFPAARRMTAATTVSNRVTQSLVIKLNTNPQ